MTQNLNLKAGELVVFSEGSYSDYGYRGSYVVLENMSHDEVMEVVNDIKENTKKSYTEMGYFESALIRLGKLAIVDVREIHLGSYGSLEV